MQCQYYRCDKLATPGHRFCSETHLNFQHNVAKHCKFCKQNHRINSRRLMLNSCGEPNCLALNIEDMFSQYQELKSRFHVQRKALQRAQRRGDEYKEDYNREKRRKRSRSEHRPEQDEDGFIPLNQVREPVRYFQQPAFNSDDLKELLSTLKKVSSQRY